MERDGKISDLTSRAERLETESEMFQVRNDSDLTLTVLLDSVLFRKQPGN